MPVAASSNSPVLLSRGNSSEFTQNFGQPIQNISLLPPPMMS
jgi:hypothetical protein